MPRKALRCLVEVNVQAVSCPGVWLPRRDDVYVAVRMFGQIRHSQVVPPTFPLLFHDRFRFDKVFYTAYEPTQVARQLDDEFVSVQLMQVTDYTDNGRVLAYFETSAKDFIYPHPSYSPTYDTSSRDVLMERTLEFPGISPKLEFTTRAVIKETKAPVLETYHDMQLVKSWENDMAIRGRSPMRHTGRQSRSRTRSVSPVLDRQMSRLNLDSRDFPQHEDDDRPPFVVRKVHNNLIERTPGGFTPRERAARRRSASPTRSPRSGPWHYENHSNYRPWYTSNQSNSVHYTNDYSSYEDDDVSLLDLHNYRRHRSPSPVQYRSSLRDRYDETPWSVRSSDRITDRVVNAIRRNQSMDHLDRYSPPSYYADRYGHHNHDKLAPLSMNRGSAYNGGRYFYQ